MDNSQEYPYFERPLVYYLAFSVFLLSFCLVFGSFRGYTVSVTEANSTLSQVNQERSTFTSSSIGWLLIFENNFGLTLIGFLPLFGLICTPMFHLNTGRIVGSLALATGTSNLNYLGLLMQTPVLWFELAAYVLAYAEVLRFTYALAQMNKLELNRYFRYRFWKTLLFVAVMLFIAALIEWKWFPQNVILFF